MVGPSGRYAVCTMGVTSDGERGGDGIRIMRCEWGKTGNFFDPTYCSGLRHRVILYQLSAPFQGKREILL